MTFPLNADLHCHSTTSDGTLTPEQLAARAAANGVDLWALTDHDEVGGQQQALEAAREQGMKYLTGVEISVTFAAVTVHIVGLGLDHTDPRMAEGLADTRDGRGPRAVEMGAQLAKVGIEGAYEGALKYVGNPRLVSRTPFARFLVESGVCRDTSAVFRRFLTEGLADTRDGRGPRARAMAEQLAQVGIHGAYEGALKYVGNPRLISRTHFARFLVDSGVCRDTSEVFRKFLTEGKPGYVPHRWAKLGDAVKWITQSGGVAVIAHPARYKFTPNEEYALFSEFKQHGGQGVEVVTGSHTAAEAVRYADMAREFGLAASRGSDFHSPDESHVDLGKLPPLPADLTPVWSLLTDRAH